jgi:hypothetical protein
MRYFVYGLAVVLAILHHDFWYWDDRTLLFGFLPIGLAYHAAFSLAAAGVWALAVVFAWPSTIEDIIAEEVGLPSTQGAPAKK